MIPGLPYETELPDRVGVLVLGSGLAGCAALLAAAEAGQYAVMLEKTSEIGGSTVKSAGLSAFAGTPEQVAQGIADSVELLRKDLLEVGRHRNDERLVDLYCEHQLETHDWLTGHGVVYGEVHAASGQSAPRSHPTDTTAMLVHLLKAAGRLGARLVLDAPAQRLVREGGRVVGVDVRTPQGTHRVLADAVVIATGGFSQNPELLTRFAPQMEHALRAGGVGCEGDGLLMAWQLGAGVVDTPYIKGTYGHFHEPHPDEDGTGILAVYKGAIAVNRDGRRFVDESRNYKEIGDAALAQPGVTTFQVFDARVLDATSDEVPIYDFGGRERAGMLVRADTDRGARDEAGPARGRAGRDGRGLQRLHSLRATGSPRPRPPVRRRRGTVSAGACALLRPPVGNRRARDLLRAHRRHRPARARRLRPADRTAVRGRRGDRRIPRRRLHDRHLHRQGRDLRPARRTARCCRGE